MQILFPDGSFEIADKLYRESPSAKVFNGLARESVKAALARLPEDQTLRVLEIGAGTGGASSYVLPEFPPERTEYTFTDVSPFFLAKAQERFASYPFVRYRTLNIEQDPAAQGFAPRQFDLIIAANVLHATADLRRTLANVKQLLTPEGVLLLLEVTRPQRWIDLSFGLTEGWWLFTDTDLRPSYPLLAQKSWTALLGEIGFADASAIPDESAVGALAENTVLLARAPKIAETTATAGTWLVFADKGGVGERLGRLLQGRNEAVMLVTPAETFAVIDRHRYTIDPACAEDYRRLVREVSGDGRPALRGAIHLWPLDNAETERMKAAEIIEAQKHGTQSVLYLVQALVTAGSQSPQALARHTRRAAGRSSRNSAGRDARAALGHGQGDRPRTSRVSLRVRRFGSGKSPAGRRCRRAVGAGAVRRNIPRRRRIADRVSQPTALRQPARKTFEPEKERRAPRRPRSQHAAAINPRASRSFRQPATPAGGAPLSRPGPSRDSRPGGRLEFPRRPERARNAERRR